MEGEGAVVPRRQALVNRCCNRRVAVCNNICTYTVAHMYIHGIHYDAGYTKQLTVSLHLHTVHMKWCVGV